MWGVVPFKSKKQEKFLWAKEPEIAKRWTKKYGSAKNTGGKVKKNKPKKIIN